jgi:hypothetical protein
MPGSTRTHQLVGLIDGVKPFALNSRQILARACTRLWEPLTQIRREVLLVDLGPAVQYREMAGLHQGRTVAATSCLY